ncbi:hypothetical protein CEE45_06935 [Candidatus Heimdallarchaeota archaeon B3_Heim]|nr:MAG: hypothetical protein CEE45_06935 [Candidatus Heimdallarchaeota archaeon B3_Heim]
MWRRFLFIPRNNIFLLILLILSGIYSPLLHAQRIYGTIYGFTIFSSSGGTFSRSTINITEGEILWEQIFDFEINDWAFSIIETSDNGLAIAAKIYYEEEGMWDQDGLLIKTDNLGEVQWTQTYGGEGVEYAYDVIQTVDGGFAMTGSTTTNSTGRTDGWLVKTSPQGKEEWSQQYAGTSYDKLKGLIQTREGGYALAGEKSDSAWIIKTDTLGNEEWVLRLGSGSKEAQEIIQTMDGGYGVVGSCVIISHNFQVHQDLCLIKLAKNGSIEWNRTYNSMIWQSRFPADYGYSVTQTADGGFFLFGDTHNLQNSTGYDFWLVKTDAAGVPLWNRTYGEKGTESLNAGIQTMDGGFALTGYTDSFGVEHSDIYLVKTDAQGVLEWNRTYGAFDWEEAFSLVQTSDSGLVILGRSSPPSAPGPEGNTNIWLLKVKGRGVPPSAPPSLWNHPFFPVTLLIGCLTLFLLIKRKH